jgi:hypothetical protein
MEKKHKSQSNNELELWGFFLLRLYTSKKNRFFIEYYPINISYEFGVCDNSFFFNMDIIYYNCVYRFLYPPFAGGYISKTHKIKWIPSAFNIPLVNQYSFLLISSLDCPFLIAPTVFSHVYLCFHCLWIVHCWLPLQFPLTFIYVAHK